MDRHAEIEKRIRETKTSKALFFTDLVNHWYPEVYDSFLRILSEYTKDRLNPADMYLQVSRLFCAHPEMIKYFCRCFPQTMSTKDVNLHEDICNYSPQSTFFEDEDLDYITETLKPTKKAKMEDDGTKAITGYGPISNASTSNASSYSQSACSSGCYPLKGEAIASCSSSSQSCPGNYPEGYKAHRTLYVSETKTKLMDGPQAYQHLTELISEISSNRIDTYSIMERASKLLQGYPELIESFNIFLPDGYRIVILSDDHEMSTD